MRFHLGPIPEDRSFLDEDPAWQPIKEPSAFFAQVLSLPLGLLAVGGSLLAIALFARHLLAVPDWWALPALLALFPAHEAVHLLCHPGQGRSDDSLAGFWPKMVVFYAHWGAAWPWRRFLACLLAPFFALTVLPIALAAVTGRGGPTLALFAVVNAAASAVDLLGSLLILQVPATALLRNVGWRTYWKPS